ncbi:MAG: hypothetical protein ISS33_07560 [Candidatus Omnitrophica bacterium]|nr:hypothetical protein [Candidatus Omnitrophota bacterium]
MKTIKRKLFKHGGSYAVDVPMDFVKSINTKEVILVVTSKGVKIRPKTESDTIESDPLFAGFINALSIDAMKHPERLHDAKETWDEEWDELLKGVSADED